MMASPVDLTIEVRSEDGSNTEFYQNDPQLVARALRLLVTSRLFTQPFLVLASEHGVSTIPSRTIDLILAHTAAPVSLALPAGLLDIAEVGEAGLDEEPDATAMELAGERPPPNLIAATHMEIHTLGGWTVALHVQAVAQATVHDERLLLVHFFDLPVVPFRLEGGGVGFINPAKISRVTAHPAVNAAPDSALPADLSRCSPAFHPGVQS